MKRLTVIALTLAATPAMAADFDPPLPQAQSATAELWYAVASLIFVAALVAVQRLVARR